MNRATLILWFSLLAAASLYYFGSRYHFAPDAQISDLKFKSKEGNILSIKDFQGQSIMLHFYAAWCAPCIKELPVLNAAKEELESIGVKIIGLSDDDQSHIQKIKTQHSLNFDVFHLEGKLRENGIPSIPTTFIINGQGHIVYSVSGAAEWNNPQVIETIKKNLEESF